MKKREVTFLLVFLMMFFLSVKAEASEMDFNARAVIPENQQDKTKTYFNLRMKPGEKQKVKLLVSNATDQEMVLAIQANTATTNQNGVIDYSQTDREKDSSLAVNFADLVTGEKEVTLKAKESREIEYEIAMPKQSFDGELLGGFYVKKVEQKTAESSEKNVQIENKYAIVIAATLNETDKVIDSQIDLKSIQPDLENYRTVVTATIQNVKPKIEDHLTVTAEVSKEGSTDVLHRATKKDMRMAPNSSFDFPIDWGQQELKPGKYQADVTISTSGGEWSFFKKFTIQKKEAQKLNSEAVELKVEKDNTIVFLGIIIGLVLLVSGLVFRNIWKEKKRRKRIAYLKRRRRKRNEKK